MNTLYIRNQLGKTVTGLKTCWLNFWACARAWSVRHSIGDGSYNSACFGAVFTSKVSFPNLAGFFDSTYLAVAQILESGS